MLVFSSGCNSCSESGNDEPAAPGLTAASPKTGTSKLDWEIIQTGISRIKFKTKIAAMADISASDIEDLIECGDQQSIGVIDPEHLKIIEKTGSESPLSFCLFMQANQKRSWMLASARAEFLKGKLVSINYRFKTEYYDTILQQIEARYSKGDRRILSDETNLAPIKQEFLLWRIGTKIWSLTRNKGDVSLKLQDYKILKKLKSSTAPADNSLDDLGLGGDDLEVDLSDI